MKNKFYIQYQDRAGRIKHAIIKSEDQYTAEKEWYENNPFTLIKKISLV